MTTLTRRDWLALTMGAGAALAFDPQQLLAQGKLLTRAIPSSGEQMPVIGLGSSATFAQVARTEDVDRAARGVQGAGRRWRHGVRHRARLRSVGGGGGPHRHRDWASPTSIFWATKLNVAGRGGGAADPAAARAQVETSFSAHQARPKIDSDPGPQHGRPPAQLPIVREFKQQGRVRYIGITTTFENQYADLVATMQKRAARLHRRRLRHRQPPRRGDDPAAGARAQDRRASPTRRSAARGCSSASAIGRCPTGPRSSTPRPGRSSS